MKKNRNKNIYIKGAKLHNLKNIDVEIPRNKLTVITGLSGSGKSSLAFDTLYAEGQRKYVESLSSYARQFLGKLDKPKVDYISGISPAIAIEQKVNTTNPRSTVGTSTEIYDYLKLLYARIGVTYSPISNNKVKKDTVTDILSFIKKLNINQKLLLLSPIKCKNKSDFDEKLDLLKNQGYSRIKYNNVVDKIDSFNYIDFNEFYLVVDRIITVNDESFYNRLADAIEVSIFEGNGVCIIEDLDWPNPTGSFWGEVNVALHKGLGLAGTITSGLLRDLDAIDKGYQVLANGIGPSHAYVHVLEYGSSINIHGLHVNDGDIIHADQHGAVVIPSDALPMIERGINYMAKKEKH